MGKYLLPKFYDLMEYVADQMNSLLSTSGPEFRTFCEMNEIVNAVVYQVNEPSKTDGFDYEHKRVLFELHLKFASSVTPLRLLDDKAMLWLERWIGATLLYKSREEYEEGGGYLHYEICYPGNRQEEVFNQYDTHRFWSGGTWHN